MRPPTPPARVRKRSSTPTGPGEKVFEAREAAGKDRHHEAVADYLDALANDATPGADRGPGDRLPEAVARGRRKGHLLLQALPGPPSRPGQPRACARAWPWPTAGAAGRPRPSPCTGELVAEDPTDGGARIGLGRSLIWDNRLHEGFKVAARRSKTNSRPKPALAAKAADFLLTVLDGYTPHLDLTPGRQLGFRRPGHLPGDRHRDLHRLRQQAAAGHARSMRLFQQPGQAGHHAT